MSAIFGAVLSAINAALGFVVRSLLVKFAVFFGLYFVTTGFMDVLSDAGLLPDLSALDESLGGISAGISYFLDVFGFWDGLPIFVNAMLARFVIRRIPLIG